ncbi:DUF6884 domain-containing protein [Microbispora sp. H11081]|uniref:DUF6884 domain-containing protein n=1 Tax=Microbispora sp. H11081 TaxID=2729107 RepID=UPI001B8C9242|nr:DUF6884 domain-containing protein [Microbispora sp. H11081]
MLSPRVLVIVPCGKAKIWDKNPHAGPTAARDAYIGAPFIVNRRYAERFGDRWVILSAKYGFLNPDDPVEGPYNVTFKRRVSMPIAKASTRRQVRDQGLDRFDQVIGLGGVEYRAVVEHAFTGANVALHFPFAGMQLGLALAATKRAVITGQALSDQ